MLHPAIASGLFHTVTMPEDDHSVLERVSKHESKKPQSAATQNDDDFGNEDLDDADLVAAAEPHAGYQDIDDIVSSQDDRALSLAGKGKARKTTNANAQKRANTDKDGTDVAVVQREPKRLPNGNWECSHPCTDKKRCKHLCCKIGMENKPRPKKPKKAKVDDSDAASTAKSGPKSTKNVKKSAATAHTNPFTAAKKSANQSLAIRHKTADRPATRETEFGDENDFWDDPDVEDALMNDNGHEEQPNGLKTSKPKFTATTGGLFVTSSPDKAQPYDEIDLSSKTFEESRHGKRPASNTTAKAVKKARLGGVPDCASNYQDYDQQDAQFVSLRDLDTSCNVSTFSKGSATSRAAATMQDIHDYTMSDDELVTNCNDAPYGWAPINSTETTPSKVLDNPPPLPYDSDGDDGLSIVESALYPTTFTAVNQPRPARPAQSRHVEEKDMEEHDTLPDSPEMLHRAEHGPTAGDVDATTGDPMLDVDEDGDLQDEGYITMQIDEEAAKPEPLTEMAQTQHNCMRAETSGRDEKDIANDKPSNETEAKDEIPAWMYEEYGEFAEFV